jgi:4Fe-4S ferredoxin
MSNPLSDRPAASGEQLTNRQHCDTTNVVVPVIDRSRCEAKADCVRVCPYGVFTVRTLLEAERRDLGWWSRLRLTLHGGKQAVASAAEACHNCGLCVAACPEDAISLVATARGASPPPDQGPQAGL